MRARVRKYGNFWIGEVYGTWSMIFGDFERVGWGCVTKKCYTKYKSEKQLRIWKEKHFGFEMKL